MVNSPDPGRGVTSWKARLTVLALVLPLSSCSDDMTGPSDLTGGVWELQSMELAAGTAFVPDDPDRFTIEFHVDDRVGVVADCNQCGGTYSLRDERLTVSRMSCTLVACPTPRGEQFASLIEGSSSFDRTADDQLEIASSEGRLVLAR